MDDLSISEDDAEEFPDLTPMLDIIFILLVFFILTANSLQHSLEIDLPQEQKEQSEPLMPHLDATLTIELFDEAPYWGISGQRFSSWEETKVEIEKKLNDPTPLQVNVAGDRQAPMEHLVWLLSLLKDHQMDRTNILMEP